MIYAFVEKIIVHAPEKIDGERHMQVDIHLKFIGNFQVAQQKPTAEEAAAEEQQRKRRALNRERAARHKEKIQAQISAAQKGGAEDEPAPKEPAEDYRAV